MANKALMERERHYRDEAAAARARLAELNRSKQEAARSGDPKVRAMVVDYERQENEVRDELETARELQGLQLKAMAGQSRHRDFLRDPGIETMLAGMAHSSSAIGRIALGDAMDANSLAESFAAVGELEGVPEGGRRGRPGPIVQQPRPLPLTLLALIPTRTFETESFPYLIEGGSFEGAAETAEGAMKPTASMTLTEGEVRAKTIAVWIKSRKQVLADIEEMNTLIQERLMYEVQARIERQILEGDGTGENIRGVLHTTGIASVPFTTGAAASDMILQGLTTVRLSGGQPDAVVLNPQDVQGMLTAKASGSGERLDSSGAFASPGASLWGTPIIQTPVVTVGSALVADWANSTCLWVREGLHTLVSDSDQDDFVANRVTILAETRVGLSVQKPSLIATVALK